MKDSKTYILRYSPELKLVLNEDSFEIIDFYNRKNRGIYSFKKLKNVELRKQKINWLFTICSWVLDAFTAISEGGIYRDKSRLCIYLTDLKLKISLNEADLHEAQRLVDSMKIKIDHN